MHCRTSTVRAKYIPDVAINAIIIAMKTLLTVIFLALALSSGAQDISWLQDRLSRHAEKTNHTNFYLHTDRKLYAPGDQLWFQIYAWNSRNAKPYIPRESLTIRLTNAANTELQIVTATIANGTGKGVIALPSTLKEGIYVLDIARDQPNEAYRTTIGVRKSAIPSFLISFELPDESLIPGTDVTATVRFADQTAEPLKKVSFGFYMNDGSGERLVTTAETDATGTYRLRFTVPANLPTGMLAFGIHADYRGDTEILQGTLKTASQNVFVRLAPEGGSLLAGVRNRVAFQAVDGYGNPFAFTGELVGDGSKPVMTFSSDSTGIGSFEFTPKVETTYGIRITQPYPVGQMFALPPVLSEGLSIRLKERRENAIVIDVVSTYSKPVKGMLAARSGERIIWSVVSDSDEISEVEIPLENIEGLVDCIFLNDQNEIETARVILWERPRLLPASIRVGQDSYQPREKVNVEITTPENTGPFNLSVSAAFQNWSSHDRGLECLQFRDDPVMDVLTFWGILNTRSPEKTDALTILSRVSTAWNRILRDTGYATASANPPIPERIISNHNFMVDTRMLYSVRKNGNHRIYRNTGANEYFLLGNTDYLRLLRPSTVPKSESYKQLLETGTPVRDVVRKIKPYDLDGGSIIFAGRRTSLIAQGGAVIVVDGIIVGTSVALLDQIVPYDVERIFVSTDPQDIQRYTGLNSVGLVEITMKRGPQPTKKLTKPETEFPLPEYREKGRVRGGRDFRNTLYWNTASSANNIVDLHYHNGDLVGSVVVSVILMDENGRFGYAEVSYEIRL